MFTITNLRTGSDKSNKSTADNTSTFDPDDRLGEVEKKYVALCPSKRFHENRARVLGV